MSTVDRVIQPHFTTFRLKSTFIIEVDKKLKEYLKTNKRFQNIYNESRDKVALEKYNGLRATALGKPSQKIQTLSQF